MAFVPEDGTGLENANSYIDVAFADAYFEDRAILTWDSLEDDAKTAALIAATDYIDARFGPYFKGIPLNFGEQALHFPCELPYVGIPTVLKKATAEYALRASQAPLAPDIAVDESGFQISEKYEKVGAIEEKTSFATIGQGSNRMLIKPYPAVDLLLRPLLKNSSGVIRN